MLSVTPVSVSPQFGSKFTRIASKATKTALVAGMTFLPLSFTPSKVTAKTPTTGMLRAEEPKKVTVKEEGSDVEAEVIEVKLGKKSIPVFVTDKMKTKFALNALDEKGISWEKLYQMLDGYAEITKDKDGKNIRVLTGVALNNAHGELKRNKANSVQTMEIIGKSRWWADEKNLTFTGKDLEYYAALTVALTTEEERKGLKPGVISLGVLSLPSFDSVCKIRDQGLAELAKKK